MDQLTLCFLNSKDSKQNLTMSYYKNNICRLCLSSEGTINIFNKNINSTASSCAEKVMFCTRVMIKNIDNLPNMICNCCVQKLNAAYEFRIQVINSDYKLRNAIKDLENLNDSEILSDGILEISLLKSEDNESINMQQTIDSNINVTDSSAPKQMQIEPQIGIIKLGEDLKINSTLEKNLMCSYCGKCFRKPNQLLVHTRIHTNEKPYKCDVCNKSFINSHHLKAHRRIHATDPQEKKPFQCKYCAKTFSENSSLSRHTKIHENVKVFMCTFCNQKFITRADVRKHLVRHSGLKPYQCKLCDKKYSNPSNLSKHKKKHSNSKANGLKKVE